MKPVPYHLELPGTPVIDCPTHPPVQDSAEVNKRFLSVSNSPSSALNDSSFSKFNVLLQFDERLIRTENKSLSRY